jgi:rod shape determining protein RodA
MTRVTEIFSPLAANERQPRVDWLMLASIAGLMIVGVFFVYSATMVNEAAQQVAWLQSGLVSATGLYGLGLASMAAVCAVDYRILARWSLVAYVATILMLIMVLIPGVGAERFGARR